MGSCKAFGGRTGTGEIASFCEDCVILDNQVLTLIHVLFRLHEHECFTPEMLIKQIVPVFQLR